MAAPAHPFRSVYFDCDSTLSTLEGIDELAKAAAPAVRAEIERLTNAAMDGELSVEEVYAQRLEALRPTRAAVQAIGARYIATLVPGTREVIAALLELGKQVGIVSGGLHTAVAVLADELGVARDRVFAVRIDFDADGRYRDFDREEPLTRNGGKPRVLAALDADTAPLAFVGDGITDLEAASAVERFIGFGGVARRRAVVDGSAHYADGPGLETVLPFVLTDSERNTLRSHPRFQSLLP